LQAELLIAELTSAFSIQHSAFAFAISRAMLSAAALGSCAAIIGRPTTI
jgi:hypothetical protein